MGKLKAGMIGALAAALVDGTAAAQEGRVRQGLVSLEDASLFYVSVGEGDPIVVAHGGPGLDHTYLRPGMDRLAASHRVVYFDQRGTGRSAADLTDSVVSFETLVDDIDRVRQILGVDRIVVLGHSYGGLLALSYALRYPANTRALILMCSVEPGSRWRGQTQARQAAARTPQDSVAMAEIMASEAFRARDARTMSEFYSVVFRSTFRDPAKIDELVLDLSAETARNGPEVARLVGGSAPVDWWDRLSQVRAPTLVIHGRSDPTPAAMARALVDSVPNARLRLLDTGHFPYVEDSQSLVAAVSSFLTQVAR